MRGRPAREYDVIPLQAGFANPGVVAGKGVAQGVVPAVFQTIPRSTGTEPGRRKVRLLSVVMLSCLS